jgi:hypothetical protein
MGIQKMTEAHTPIILCFGNLRFHFDPSHENMIKGRQWIP